MSTPHGNFRWNGTRWEATSYTPPPNAATPPTPYVQTSGTSGGTPPNMGYVPTPPPTSGQPIQVQGTPGTGPGILTPPPKPGLLRRKTQEPPEPTRIETESASVSSIRNALWKQQRMLEDMADGLVGDDGQNIDDALYFIREALEALNKVTGE